MWDKHRSGGGGRKKLKLLLQKQESATQRQLKPLMLCIISYIICNNFREDTIVCVAVPEKPTSNGCFVWLQMLPAGSLTLSWPQFLWHVIRCRSAEPYFKTEWEWFLYQRNKNRAKLYDLFLMAISVSAETWLFFFKGKCHVPRFYYCMHLFAVLFLYMESTADGIESLCFFSYF